MTLDTSPPSRTSPALTYQNPVWDGYFADPYVLPVPDGYLAYGTGPAVDGLQFRVLHSTDLVDWTLLGGALAPVAPEVGSDYWAPEVVEVEGTYWMYYSVGFDDTAHHLRVARSSSPRGPFRDLGLDLTPTERFAIDPHPFRDEDGRWYLYYARDVLDADRVGTHLAVAELDDMTSLHDPTSVLSPSADWQIYQRDRAMYGRRYDWHTLEGPTVRRHAGRYYCTYSGGSYLGAGYQVAWAVADHPRGPWREPEPPRQLLTSVEGHVRGPGHNSVVTISEQADLIVYHAWDAAGRSRQLCIDPLYWTDQGPRVDGPSWTRRPRPSATTDGPTTTVP